MQTLKATGKGGHPRTGRTESVPVLRRMERSVGGSLTLTLRVKTRARSRGWPRK